MTWTDANPSDILSESDKSAVRGCDVNIAEAIMQQLCQSGSSFSGVPTMRALRRGQHLYWPGDLSKHVYSVKSGTLKTYGIEDDGREQITGFHTAGKVLGLDALVQRPMRCGALAVDVTTICQIPVQMVILGSGESGQLRLQLLEEFRKEIVRLEARLSICCNPAPQRLAAFILSMEAEPAEVHLPMSHKEIGNYLHLVPETVSRLLARFQRCGWLSTHGHRVDIRDRAALGQIAAGHMPGATSATVSAAKNALSGAARYEDNKQSARPLPT